jgi:hypothetical protein
MKLWQTESHSFLVGTFLLVGLIIISLLLCFFCYKKTIQPTQLVNHRLYMGLSGFFLVCAVAGTWSILVEPYRLVVRDFEINTTDLPPMKIAVVADLHLRWGKSKNFVKKIVATINAQNPDIVLMPGDFLTSKADTYASQLSALKDIKSPVYYVLGNHDYTINGTLLHDRAQKIRQVLRQAELVELANEALPWSEKNIFIAGIEDNYLGFDNMDLVLQKVGKNPYILLAHSPDIVDVFDDNLELINKPRLIISGHTHCGQIRLPFIGAIPGIIPTDHGREYDQHWYPEQQLFVTCGVGESGPAVRFMNPPEVVILNIVE